MSFQIHAAGRTHDAIEQVKKAEGYGDTSQFEATQRFILAELEHWPANGVIVEASGHHDAHTRSVNISIRPLYLKD